MGCYKNNRHKELVELHGVVKGTQIFNLELVKKYNEFPGHQQGEHKTYWNFSGDKNNLNNLYESYKDLDPIKTKQGNYDALVIKFPNTVSFVEEKINKNPGDQLELFQLENPKLKSADDELNSKVKAFLDTIGVSIKSIDSLENNAVAKANILKGIIEVVEGKADITTLPEEAAHFIVEILGEDHPLVKSMMQSIVSTPLYQQVKQEYWNVYNGNEFLIAKEAVGKLIAERIILKHSKPTQEELAWWKKVLYVLKKMFSNISSDTINSYLDAYDKTAEMILNPNIITKQNKVNKPLLEMLQLKNNVVKYGLKAVEILNSTKASQVFEKGKKNNWDLNKILTELSVPKEQKQLILDLGITDREQIILELISNYNYTIEVNTAKEEILKGGNVTFNNLTKDSIKKITDAETSYNVSNNGNNVGKYYIEYFDNNNQSAFNIYENYKDALEDIKTKGRRNNSQYYSNLTVPGGTNYTENEISTLLITPFIKGHAQFSTDKGIGWFRSDEQIKIDNYENWLKDNKEFYKDIKDEKTLRMLYANEISSLEGNKSKSILPTKTRRILEIQSDLFQKGRDNKSLVNDRQYDTKIPTDEVEEKKLIKDGYIKVGDNDYGEPIYDKSNNTQNKENQFLQLLNKDSNWVTFFIKSIIQDSAKKGYEKVLFPLGNTASKIEGHTTLEEFKKQKEDRIKQLEQELEINKQKQSVTSFDNITQKDFSIKNEKGERIDYINRDNRWVKQKITNEGEFKQAIPTNEDVLNAYKESLQFLTSNENIITEINQIKQELERVETEGFGALKPIYNFYENTVTNILNKTYGKENVKQVTDEYGNTWNEVNINTSYAVTPILLQMSNKLSQQTTELYQLSNTSVDPKLIIEKLDQTQREILDPDYSKSDRYKKADGGEVDKRVTDNQKKLFEKIVGKDKAADINAKPDNIIKRNTGTALHNIAEQYFNFKLNKGPSVNLTVKLKDGEVVTINNQHYEKLTQYWDTIISDILNTQNKINSKEKPIIRLENKVYDSKRDIAGSIDLLVIYSDGSASVYDYKFVNLEEEDGIVNTDKLYNKEDSWDMQMSEYKSILRENYGIKQFRKSRILPINVRYKFKGGKLIPIIHSINTSIDSIPLRELTDDIQLNKLLEKLIGLKDKLKKELKTSDKKEVIKIRLRNLTDSIKEIQLNKDVSFILKEIESTSKIVNNGLGIKDTTDENYITDPELTEYKEILDIYTNIAVYTRNTFKDLKSTDKEKFNELYSKLSHAGVLATLTRDSINEEIKERVIEEAANKDITNITTPQKEGSMMGNLLTHLSNIKHPLFKTLWSFVKSSQDKTRNATNTLEKELKTKTDKLIEWGKSKGLTGTDIFKYIINPKTGNLIAQYKEDLFTQIKEQRSKKNVEWFKANYIQTAEDKTKFEAKKKEVFATYEKKYGFRGEDYVNKFKKNWLESNDLATETAWISPYSFKTLKDNSKWENEDYKKLSAPGNEAVKEYYEFYRNINKEIAEILPVEIKSNFVANIHKDMIDLISQNGINSISGMGETLLQSLQVREEEHLTTHNDPVTGKPLYNTPILFTNPLTDKNGKVDNSLKSYDLSRSLLLFANMAYNYKHMNEIKDVTLNLREVLASSDQILTDKFGRPLKQEGKYVTGPGNKQNLEAFDSFLNYYIGGQTIQTKDSAFNYKDKSYSRNRLIRQLLTYFSVNKLALNPISGVANYIGAKSNLYFTALKESYFTKEQMRESEKLFASQNVKYLNAINYFNIGSKNHTMGKANALSVDALSKTLTVDNMYVLQRAGDESIERQLVVSMMMNYGLDTTNNKVTKLSNLPKGTKSLWELSEFNGDKKTGSFSIPGMTEEQYNNFRRKVDYVSGMVKGQNSEEDIALYKTTLAGMLLGQFRGWMPRMIKERFGETGYNETMEEIEMGKFRVLFGEFVQAGMLNSMKIFLDGAPFINYKYSQVGAQHYYEKYLAENPELDPNEFTLDKYIEVRRGQLRAAAAEIRMYCLLIIGLTLMGGDWDDDGKADYKKYWATRKIIGLMDRTQLELGFFLNPSNVTELIKSPIPSFGLITDLKKTLDNTFDESRDVIFGEDESNDKTPLGYRISKMIPVWKTTADFIEVFEDTGDDTKYKPKKEERGIQLEF